MDKAVANKAYDKLAKLYNEKIDTKPHNAYYDRPAVQSLVPNIKDKTILDAGCGTGVYLEWLIQQEANAFGFDASEKMLECAKERVGNKAKLFKGAFEDDFSFLEDNFFDGIISALAIHYVENLEDLFVKFNKTLKKDGWLIFSTEHPFFKYDYYGIKNYFQSRKVESDWKDFGEIITITSYYHSLSKITEALYNSGFIIERIVEPKPTKEFEKVNKKQFDSLMEFPLFICFKAVKINEC